MIRITDGRLDGRRIMKCVSLSARQAENGLTLDELLNCMTAAVVTYGFGAYERDYRKVFVAEARKVWKMKNRIGKASL